MGEGKASRSPLGHGLPPLRVARRGPALVLEPPSLHGSRAGGHGKARERSRILDGFEIGSGSIRIHEGKLQERIFRVLGIGDEEAEVKFGFLLRAFRLGAPPHGGIALGMDRLTAIFAGVDSLREVIAFPKTTSATDLMTGSPSPVDPVQLEQVSIKIRPRTLDELDTILKELEALRPELGPRRPPGGTSS